MTSGYIYCLSNPSFKANIYKIGYTTMNITRRIRCLYKTGVPNKFIISFAKKVRKCRVVEQEIHIRLNERRINPSREFFKCPLSNIKRIFDEIPGVWWTENDVEEIKEKMPAAVNRNIKRRKLNRKVKKCAKFSYKVK
jgi:hypothetical protein